jgi:hypothetical protein
MKKTQMPIVLGGESVVAPALRFFAYTIAVAWFTAMLPSLAESHSVDVFKENGLIEWVQFGLLVATTLVFVGGAHRIAGFRSLFLLLASLSAFAAFRELDALLNSLIPVLGWKIGSIVLLAAAVMAWKDWDQLRLQIAGMLPSRAFATLWAGFVVAVPVGQLLGHGPFLEVLMGDDYNRDYKRVIEESAELIGYMILFAGSIEAIAQMKAASLTRRRATELNQASP